MIICTPLSLSLCRFQHHMLLKNPEVTDHNKQSLVETFRSIAEILIWGDQNDSRVFE
jgi:protein CLEC16A